MRVILKGQRYRIKSANTSYFQRKYGEPAPVIIIEGEDTQIWPAGWGMQNGNPACVCYAIRSGYSGIPLNGKVYYGHIEGNGLGELVHESELATMPKKEVKRQRCVD